MNNFDSTIEKGERIKRGAFYTKEGLAEKAYRIINLNPSFLLEPFCGTGSLLTPFSCPGLVNDINPEAVEQVVGYPKDSVDIFDYSADELIERWKLPEGLLIYTNPPIGASVVNSLSADVPKGKSRKIKIRYREELLKYGKGDLALPAIGQLIELNKRLGGYLAIFSQMGIFCGRKRYNKLLQQLLSYYTFKSGHIFSGKEFNNVNKDVPIAFTCWAYGGQTPHLDLKFDCYGEKIIFKKPKEV